MSRVNSQTNSQVFQEEKISVWRCNILRATLNLERLKLSPRNRERAKSHIPAAKYWETKSFEN